MWGGGYELTLRGLGSRVSLRLRDTAAADRAPRPLPSDRSQRPAPLFISGDRLTSWPWPWRFHGVLFAIWPTRESPLPLGTTV